MRAGFAIAGLMLAGCATSASLPPAVVIAGCPAVVAYPLATEQAVAAELAKLPPTDPLVQLVTDYGKMRAAARDCAAR